MVSIEFEISEVKSGDDITSLTIDLRGAYESYTKDITGLSHPFSEPYPVIVDDADKISIASAFGVDNINTIIEDLKTQSGQSDLDKTEITYSIL